MKITSDGRPLILFERFGFTHTGLVSLSLSAVSYSSSLTSPDPSLFGFFLLSQDSLLRLLLEQQQQPRQQSCPIKSHYALTLLTFAELANGDSTNRTRPPPWIHLLMGVLLVMKALDLLWAAEEKHYVKVTGTPHGWDVVFYVFQFIKGVLFFNVVVLVGTGWSFLKPFLQDREKKMLIVVIPLQVVANIAAAIIGETSPFIKDWKTWKQLFLIIDIVCCCAVIFPIVWSIRSLRETSKTDGKAARNLAKLTLFKKFYILVVGYLYFTRIVVFALETIVAYNYQSVGAAMGEGVSLMFYGLMSYVFRPVERNVYFVIDDEEEEATLCDLYFY